MVDRTEYYGQSDKDIWETPSELVDDLEDALNGIDLDPCAGPDTNIGDTNYTVSDDGLSMEWHGSVFVNPPFTEKSDWLDKTIQEVSAGNASVVVVLTPDSTDVQSWWHGKIAPHASYICFLEGRLAYIDPDTGHQLNSPPFGTALSVFGEPSDNLVSTLNDWGQVVQTV
ncbi:DNA N-6-adenine-methyltransferase [Halorubrum sp. AD140]|uniref:DNA N-6-adenine-methyltransferase n=1 Tax=Halorubrum sp. AD140 TaxID=3050073 RepID=UPI002ACC725E|nr:DNA N-6-adenine-methyltransferase [Halorubrum sp. AD140]MDZ5810353.1 DNA N-6-adenine-methyltransferase [Halorubrum sp. AD140]